MDSVDWSDGRVWEGSQILGQDEGAGRHQEKSWLLLSASFFSVISPAKPGRLGSFYFYEVDTWLSKMHFCALSATFSRFPALPSLSK